jgi:hypothetical protein
MSEDLAKQFGTDFILNGEILHNPVTVLLGPISTCLNYLCKKMVKICSISFVVHTYF